MTFTRIPNLQTIQQQLAFRCWLLAIGCYLRRLSLTASQEVGGGVAYSLQIAKGADE